MAVKGKYLLAGINTSNDFTNPSGKLAVYSLANPLQPQWIADLDMGGQPDSVAISPDGKYAAIVVENERDEDYNDGLIPQLPPGHLMVVTMAGDVADWRVRKVELTGLAEIAPSDPEPEYVAISRWNIAAVTMQENNHIALVDLRKAQVINDFSAGSVDLFNIDTEEDDVINPVDTILDRKREPDAITPDPDPNRHAVWPAMKPSPTTVTIVPPVTIPDDGDTDATRPTALYSTCTPLRLITPASPSDTSTTCIPLLRALSMH